MVAWRRTIPTDYHQRMKTYRLDVSRRRSGAIGERIAHFAFEAADDGTGAKLAEKHLGGFDQEGHTAMLWNLTDHTSREIRWNA